MRYEIAVEPVDDTCRPNAGSPQVAVVTGLPQKGDVTRADLRAVDVDGPPSRRFGVRKAVDRDVESDVRVASGNTNAFTATPFLGSTTVMSRVGGRHKRVVRRGGEAMVVAATLSARGYSRVR